MKPVYFKNKMNGEKFICENVRDVQVIDGIEYLIVRKTDSVRKFMMRKEALQKVRFDEAVEK